MDITAEVPHISTMKTPTDFEWDEAKAEANLAKHKVPFPFATRIFLDPNVTVIASFPRRTTKTASRPSGVSRVNFTSPCS